MRIVSRLSFNKAVKPLRQALAVWLIVWLALFNLAAPAFADESSGSGTPPTDSSLTQPSSEIQAPADGQDTPPAGDQSDQSHDTAITTGDSTSSVDVSNAVNTNTTTNGATTTSQQQPEEDVIGPGPESASSTPPSESSSDTASNTAPDAGFSESADSGTSSPVTIDVDNTNGAMVAAAADAQASTGGNEASSTAGNVSVQTGDGTATVNLVNVVNTNITGSDGLFLLLSALGGLFGDVDIRSLESGSDPCSGQCGLFGTIMNTNDASVVNDVVAGASTGDNAASSTGSSVIRTGNAYAGANILNLVNSNITGSNYVVLMLNNFGDWAGDLVLPSKYSSADATQQNCCNGGPTDVTNANTAGIENNVSVDANTGDNTADGTGTNTVVTGNAAAGANTVNQVNQNIFKNNSVVIVIRVFGNWLGNVFSAPDDVSWSENNGHIMLFTNGNGAGSAQNSGDGSGSGSSGGTVSNTNNALIQNNIRVFALTGNNKIGGGSGQIQTGNATAAANIANVANTNIVGRNWILALVNVFGNWRGNVAFGRPDLWVGQNVLEVPSEVRPGMPIQYELTVANRGDTDATNVVVHDGFDGHLLAPASIGSGQAHDSGVSWNLGTLKPGETRKVAYTLAVANSFVHGTTAVTHSTSVTGTEPDGKPADNRDSVSYVLNFPFPPQPFSFLELTKTNTATGTVIAGSTVNYNISLYNRGAGAAYDVFLTDTLTYNNDDGHPLQVKQWQLGEVRAYEEISIDYGLQLSPKAPPGLYRNTVTMFARDAHGFSSPFYLQAVSDIHVERPVSAPGNRSGGAQGTASSTEAEITKTIPPPPADGETSDASDSSQFPPLPQIITPVLNLLAHGAYTGQGKMFQNPHASSSPMISETVGQAESIGPEEPVPMPGTHATQTEMLLAAALGALKTGWSWLFSLFFAAMVPLLVLLKRRRERIQ